MLQKKGVTHNMNFLQKMTKAQREELRSIIKQEEEDRVLIRRAQAILLLEERISATTIEAIVGLKREVVVKLRRIYLRKGLEALRSKRKKKKITELLSRNQKAYIVGILNTKKPSDFGFTNREFWTAAILGQLIQEQYGVKYKSKTSLYLIFKEAKFTFRKPEKQSERRNEQQIAEWKLKYEPIIKEECVRSDTIVLVGDEAIMTSETRLQRVWLPLNAPAFVQDTASRKTVHFYGFLNVQSGEASVFKTTAQTGEITVSVLKKLASKHPRKRIVIFWDNASWHKSETVRAYLTATKQFQLYNFPPYAPDLNPQEHVWKELREKVLNNRLIGNIETVAQEAVEFLNNSLFKYKFFGLHGTYNM
jgi:transposase